MFLFVVIQISALAGTDIVTNGSEAPEILDAPGSWDYLLYPINNVGYFFTLMFVNSSYAFLGIVILTPFTIALIWAVLELLRGV
jgi:hypothetical protein